MRVWNVDVTGCRCNDSLGRFWLEGIFSFRSTQLKLQIAYGGGSVTTRNVLITEGFLSKALGPSRRLWPVGKFKIPKDLAKALTRRFSSAANQHCLPSSIGGGEVASRWLSGAFRSSSLGVKSSIKGFWLTADFLPFAPVVSIIPAVDILCCASSHVVKNVWKVPTQRVKVGCKRAELKYPTVHHFQVGKVHTLVFAMFIVSVNCLMNGE
ncbi:hypothetical protein V8G54_035302 [Vigna mungo]|uniref:Uncharacterized protein n=1 Tax=Vigna mungo TaxID=3915 RepID=A0AAQ3RE93_VIGMU